MKEKKLYIILGIVMFITIAIVGIYYIVREVQRHSEIVYICLDNSSKTYHRNTSCRIIKKYDGEVVTMDKHSAYYDKYRYCAYCYGRHGEKYQYKTFTDNVSYIYAKARQKGILTNGLTEEMFREQTKTDEGLRSFYDIATANGMKFHPFEEFKERFRKKGKRKVYFERQDDVMSLSKSSISSTGNKDENTMEMVVVDYGCGESIIGSREWLYKNMTKAGYNVGKDYNQFNEVLQDDASRQWLYNEARKMKWNVGDEKTFNNAMGYDVPKP